MVERYCVFPYWTTKRVLKEFDIVFIDINITKILFSVFVDNNSYLWFPLM